MFGRSGAAAHKRVALLQTLLQPGVMRVSAHGRSRNVGVGAAFARGQGAGRWGMHDDSRAMKMRRS